MLVSQRQSTHGLFLLSHEGVSYAVICCRATHGLPAYGPPCTVGVLAGTHGGHIQGDEPPKRQPFRVGWSRCSVMVVFVGVDVVVRNACVQLRILSHFEILHVPHAMDHVLRLFAEWVVRVILPQVGFQRFSIWVRFELMNQLFDYFFACMIFLFNCRV